MNQLLRISISGSHCTGKTTLSQRLADRLNRDGIKTHVAPEPIRQLPGQADQLPAVERYLQLLRVHFQRLTQQNCQCCIYDRSLLDFCAYVRLSPAPLDNIDALARELLPVYLDYFVLNIYLPIEFAMIPDARRPIDESYRMKIDQELLRLFQSTGVEVKEVRGSIEHRIEEVSRLVQDLAPMA